MSLREKITTNIPARRKREGSTSKVQKSLSSRSTNSPIGHVLHLQRTIGNQAVQRLIKCGMLQAELKIGKFGDSYEQEADLVSAQAMRISGPQSFSDNDHLSLLDEKKTKGDLGQSELIQRNPEKEKEPQIFGRPPPGVGDYVPDRPTVPIKEPEHKLITSGTTEYTYDEWITSQLGRDLTADERNAFERGCVGLMLLRLGYPDKNWPWEIPGNECWLTESKALQRQKEMKAACNGFPPAMYAFQSDGGWKPGKEPNEKQIKGEEPVDPNNVKMAFMPDPDYNLWNFATRHKDVWEWMNHAKTYSTAEKPWRVRVRSNLPSDLGAGKPIITLFGLACPKVPAKLPSPKTPQPQPKPPQKGG